MDLSEIIDITLQRAEQGDPDVSDYYSDLVIKLPEVFSFLFDEDTRLLLEPEHDYLLFLAMIILEVIGKVEADISEVRLEDLSEAADNNWGLLEFTSLDNLTATTNSRPAHLLYVFLEDACTPVSGHEILSEAAVELVYVKCKSLIDCAAFRRS